MIIVLVAILVVALLTLFGKQVGNMYSNIIANI